MMRMLIFVYSLVVVAHEVPDQLWLMLGKRYIKQFESHRRVYYRRAKMLSRMGESAKRFPTREAILSKRGKTSCETHAIGV